MRRYNIVDHQTIYKNITLIHINPTNIALNFKELFDSPSDLEWKSALKEIIC